MEGPTKSSFNSIFQRFFFKCVIVSSHISYSMLKTTHMVVSHNCCRKFEFIPATLHFKYMYNFWNLIYMGYTFTCLKKLLLCKFFILNIVWEIVQGLYYFEFYSDQNKKLLQMGCKSSVQQWLLTVALIACASRNLKKLTEGHYQAWSLKGGECAFGQFAGQTFYVQRLL